MPNQGLGTYSFLDVDASIIGVGGSFALGNESGAAEEGITVAMTEDKGTMTIGADGVPMQSLHAGKSGKITIRLLKTSPVNAKLSAMYNIQTTTSAAYASNVLNVKNKVSGDSIIGLACAFAKFPDLAYAKDGGMVEWVFNCGIINQSLGAGLLANIGALGAQSV